MKTMKILAALFMTLFCIILSLGLQGCGGNDAEEPVSTPTPTLPPPPPPSTPESTPEPIYTNLVAYDGIVENIFFHEIVAYPELAFNGRSRQAGFDAEMVTVSEYTQILQSLYDKNYILVNLNDVWEEYLADSGRYNMRRATLMIPEGKKPLVISYDDLSFYEIDKSYGIMSRYIIGADGEVWAEGYDPDGNYVISQDLAAITVLDKFIRENPDFSLNGAKGCIAFTGYEGILGYRTNNDLNDTSPEARTRRMQEIARAEPVVRRLKETGWYFASHSYGHIYLDSASLEKVKTDADRWLEEVGSLVGKTQIFIYPYGRRLDGADQNAPGPAFIYYIDLGFRIFLSVGPHPLPLGYKGQIKTEFPAIIDDRRLIGGTTLRFNRESRLQLFDAREIFDPLRPAQYGNDWEEES
ncbi:MAG: polysaccharide deacetylase family protein [Oscillospiraceae bacterium]|nr:polysaccharide deacetylase family protein [Oscillospiraceae bacterium]